VHEPSECPTRMLARMHNTKENGIGKVPMPSFLLGTLVSGSNVQFNVQSTKRYR
jgi:hypothetical protein